MNVKNLHKQQDWEKYYKSHAPLQVKLKSGIFTSYDVLLCDTLLSKYLPKYRGTSKKQPVICELGSGDGMLVKKIAGLIGHKPFGIEYSKKAVKISKINGVEAYVADAFDEKVVSKFKNHFDVVFSYGFVEHIIPPEKAVKLHIC